MMLGVDLLESHNWLSRLSDKQLAENINNEKLR